MNAGATTTRRDNIPMKNIVTSLAAIAALASAAQAAPDVRITEVMYTGLFGEFIEITNVGDAQQNMSGWSFSDNARDVPTDTNPKTTSLSGLVALDAGEVAIITEVSSTIFIQAWYTEPTTETATLTAANIVANNSVNLGRSDEVNIYASGAPTGEDYKDRLTYNDQGTGTVDGVRSEDISAKVGTVGANLFNTWTLSGTEAGGTPNGNAWKAGVAGAPGPIGSPGKYPN